MADRLALKRLTASDLTFFESLFRSLNVGNQKSINLNADVFIHEFYQTLPSLIGSVVTDVITVSLTLVGPEAAPPYVISRAVTKRDAYKNWRLNGEFIRDPEDQPKRFDILAAGDLALIDFFGDPAPQKISLLLIAQKSAIDSPVYKLLAPKISSVQKTMVKISRQELADALAGAPPSHPVWAFAEDPEFDAALGGIDGTEVLAKKPTKSVSAAALAAAKVSAENNGREGEAIAWSYIKGQMAEGTYAAIEWASETNAVSSYDFAITETDGSQTLIDAKSTNGEFANRIHLSTAELKTAAAAKRYDLWRIYKLDEDGACLKITKSISGFASAVLAGLAPPKGVTIDSISIDPNVFTWGPEIQIERPDEANGKD